ncbi:MAG: LuxR C-terminal-related transcriptional regulator [Caldilineaceae bacterium]
MSTPILATKLYIPPQRPTLVRRSRLLERLNAGLHGKLTLISAPAGFGKTTLVSSWIDDLRLPIDDSRADTATEEAIVNRQSKIVNQAAWLSLDEGDSDPTRFLVYLIAALQTVAAQIGQEVLGVLHSPQPPPMDALLTTLINDISAIPEHFVLVLDDYHTVDTQAIDQALAFLIEHLPPQMHLVITTREDPNLPLASLRARGLLTEVRAAHLRFTPAEATAFLNQMMGLDLAVEEVAALEARTEGWIAGLQLAALSMQEHHPGAQDRAGFIRSFTGSHRFVMDYLLEEVLHQQPEPIQTFLLHTSILDRLCGPLCDAVLGELEMGDGRPETEDGRPVISPRPSQTVLEFLEQANLFLVPLDNERRWYRYHHLFADLLRQRLQRQAAPTPDRPSLGDGEEAVAALHRRASRWHEENGLAIEALRHALAAADFARAAALLEQTWRTMDESRRSARWLGWVQQLPDEVVRARPVLSAAYGWALLDCGELEAADTRLRDAERWLATITASETQSTTPAMPMLVTDEEEFQALPATIAAARTYYALARGDLPRTKQYAQRTLALLPADNHLRRGVPAALLGLAYWADGELALAHRTFADAIASFQKAGNILFAITGAYILADMQRVQGRLQTAVQSYQQALQLAAEQGELVRRGSADLHTGLSELACERGDLAAATAYLQQSEKLGAQSPLPRWRYRWTLAQARLKQAQGELDAALDWLDEAAREYVRGPVPDVRPLTAMQARIWIAQGRLPEAWAWAQEQGVSAADGLSYLREFEHITLARLLIAHYRSAEEAHSIATATDLLARLRHAAEAGERLGSVIEILLLQALAHAAQNDIPSARIPLTRALTLAGGPIGAAGYVRLFVDEGTPMAYLLAEAAAQGIMPDYTATLLAAFGAETQNRENKVSRQASPLPVPPVQDLIEPLSERELEVLHLIAQGLSNREISERLFIALSTVKGHNRVIFGKLQVNRRTEAVARARELGLV